MRRNLHSARRDPRDGRRGFCRGGRAGGFSAGVCPADRAAVGRTLLPDARTAGRIPGAGAGECAGQPGFPVRYGRGTLSLPARACGACPPEPPREAALCGEAGRRACGAEPALEGEDVLPVMLGHSFLTGFGGMPGDRPGLRRGMRKEKKGAVFPGPPGQWCRPGGTGGNCGKRQGNGPGRWDGVPHRRNAALGTWEAVPPRNSPDKSGRSCCPVRPWGNRGYFQSSRDGREILCENLAAGLYLCGVWPCRVNVPRGTFFMEPGGR